jgi:hypothetical protein
MANSLLDRCRFNPTLGGTTDWVYSSAVTGYNSPALANAVNGIPYSIVAESGDLSQWEIASSNAYNSSTGTFPRTTVLFNSSGTGTLQSGAGTKINFSTVPQVAIVALAEDLVRSIAGNAGAFTLNSASGLTNSTNDILLSQASSSQFGAVKVDNSTIKATAGIISTTNPLPAPITASLGADVALNNIANYFDGPSIAQGTTGTWFVSATVTLTDTTSAGKFNAKLWDGTTIIASGSCATVNNVSSQSISISGFITSPAGNIKVSVQDVTNTTGKIQFNKSGNSKDSTISAFRII